MDHGTFSDRPASEVMFSDFSGALDFEHIEEQAEGIFGGRKVYFQLLFQVVLRLGAPVLQPSKGLHCTQKGSVFGVRLFSWSLSLLVLRSE